jgi:hypothetical protein
MHDGGGSFDGGSAGGGHHSGGSFDGGHHAGHHEGSHSGHHSGASAHGRGRDGYSDATGYAGGDRWGRGRRARTGLLPVLFSVAFFAVFVLFAVEILRHGH